MSHRTTTTTVIVKYVTCRPCTNCERPLKGDRLGIQYRTESRLSFGVGCFCSVRCLLAFASKKHKAGHGTIRGWAFGEPALR